MGATHRCPALFRRFITASVWTLEPVTFTSFAGCDQRTISALVRKHTVKSSQIDSRFGCQCRQFRDETQWFKDNVSGPSRYGVFNSYRTSPSRVTDRRCSDTGSGQYISVTVQACFVHRLWLQPPACNDKPVTLPTHCLPSLAGIVCRVNTLRP